MQMRAVVELAILRMRLEVRHVIGQLHRLDVVQAKLLKAGRVNQRRGPGLIDPVQRRAGGGVFAGVEGLRNLRRQHACIGHQQVRQAAFPRPRRPQHQRFFVLQQRHQFGRLCIVCRRCGVFRLDRQWQHLVAHTPIGRKFGPGPAEGLDQVAFIQRNDGLDALGFRRNQGTCQLAFRKFGFCGNQDQDLVQIGGKRLGPHFILPVKQVAALFYFFDRAFVLRGQPADAVADDDLAFLAARVANDPLAGFGFNQHMAAKTCHHQSRLRARQRRSAGTCRP